MKVSSGGPPLQIVLARDGEGMVIQPAEAAAMVITPAPNAESMRIEYPAQQPE